MNYFNILYNTEGFEMDTQSRFDTVTVPEEITPSDNMGLFSRAEPFRTGAVEMLGPLVTDLAQQDRLIINGVPLHLKLWPAKDSFMLLSGSNDYKFRIVDAVLYLAMVKVSPGVVIGHAEALKEKQAQYPFTRSVIKTYNLAAGQFDAVLYPIFTNEVPSEIIVTMVESRSYNGNFQYNPYNFQNFDLNYISLTVDGQSVPHGPLQPNYTKNWFSDCYSSFFQDGQISQELYKNGCCLYKFKLSPLHTEDCLSVTKTGETRIYLRFNNALPRGVTVLVYGRFPDLLQIDEHRKVSK